MNDGPAGMGAPSTPGGPGASGANRAWALVFLAAALFIAVRLALRPLVVNQDAALYLHCGRLLLQGLRPYVDFADLNPPMVMYVNVLPAILSSTFSIPLIPAFHVLVFVLVLYSALLTWRLLHRSALDLMPHEPPLAGLLILIFSFYLLNTPDSDWGQREHLFVLVYAPFFFARWIRWSGGHVGPAAGVICGALAAVGACLKPHFALIAVVTELAQWLARRRWRPLLAPEAAVFVLGGLAYALHFLLLPREVFEAFFDRWVPLVAQGYGAYNRGWREVLLRPEILAAVLGAGLGVWGGRPPNADRARAARLWALFTVVALLTYASQHKGWAYQLIPALFGGMFAGLLGLSARFAGRAVSKPGSAVLSVRAAAYVLVGSILANGMLVGAEALRGFRPWPDPGIGAILDRYSDEGDPILFLTTDVGAAYPLMLQTGRTAASRYIWTFPLAMIYARKMEQEAGWGGAYPAREQLEGEELRLIRELAEDVARSEPAMILINAQEPPQGLPPGFTIPEYFEAIGFIDREIRNYRYVETAFLYRIYVREAESAPAERPSSAGGAVQEP